MKISQREAHRLRQRVRQLERERELIYRRWSTDDWPSFKCLGRERATEVLVAKVFTARTLGHPVVCVQNGTDLVYFAGEKP